MQNSFTLCLTVLAVLFSAPAFAQLSTTRFANVFLENEPVIVNAESAGEIALEDADGRVIRAIDAQFEADFGTQPPGYYEAVYKSDRLPIVVLISPEKRVKGDSAAAIDNAMSWLVPVKDFNNIARILRLVGISWVRERLNWGEVANPDGTYDFGKYVLSAEALSQEGIKVYQVFHDSPIWAREDKSDRAAPDDLRLAYNFGKAFAKEFKGKVFAWEFWNEPDIAFFYHTSSECAALQKAVYLGAKSVDPALKVLGPSIAITGPFESNLLANDIGWYMDIWNYHIYSSPENYLSRAKHFREVMAKHGQQLPMWTTEAGDGDAQGQDGVLSGDALWHQARFASRAIPTGISTGVERFFYFVFPFYREGAHGWGLFGPENKYPYPALAAVSNATYSLGKAKYVGTLKNDSKDQRAMLFDRGDNTYCFALWNNSTEAATLEIPLDWDQVVDARYYLGKPVAKSTGPVKLDLSDGAAFIITKSLPNGLEFQSSTPMPKLTQTVKPKLTKIVPRILCPGPVWYVPQMKSADAYIVDPMNRVNLSAEVYNFGDKEIKGEIILTAVSNCTVSNKSIKCTVPAGGRVQTPFAIRLKSEWENASVSIYVSANGEKSSTALTCFTPDLNLIPLKEGGMQFPVSAPEDWEVNIVAGAELKISQDPESGVLFVSTFPDNVDKWTYPQTKSYFVDLSTFDALQFEYKTGPGSRGVVRAMLVDENGDYFILSALPCSEEWKLATVLFKDNWQFEAGDAKLDLRKVARIRVGANSETPTFALSVRNLRAVKL